MSTCDLLWWVKNCYCCDDVMTAKWWESALVLGQILCRSAKGSSLVQWNDEMASQQVPSGHFSQQDFDLQLLSGITSSYRPWFLLSSLWRALLSTLSLSQDRQRRCYTNLLNLFFHLLSTLLHANTSEIAWFQGGNSIRVDPTGAWQHAKQMQKPGKLQTSTWQCVSWLPALNAACSD